MVLMIVIKMSEIPKNSSNNMSLLDKFFNEIKAELSNSTKSASIYFSYDFEQDRPIPESKRFVWELYPENS